MDSNKQQEKLLRSIEAFMIYLDVLEAQLVIDEDGNVLIQPKEANTCS